ncbi:MAG: hypothetical protein SNJ59_09620 [Aggregatilineales bacterium]
MNNISGNFHVDYPDIVRHWSPKSEKYAGVDCLITALRRGWKLEGDIYQRDFWHAGTRQVVVFYVPLVRGDERMVMPLISNPYAQRLLYTNKIVPKPYSEFEKKRKDQQRA